LTLSSVQSALLCGIRLQNITVNSLTAELGLPANQVLAMFNKSVQKMSMALNVVIEKKEKKSLLSGEKRKQAEEAAENMKDVAEQTLDEDVTEAANEAMETLKADAMATLPPEISEDRELMQYVVKGSDNQWKKALEDKELDGPSTVQIHGLREKRRAVDEDDMEREDVNEKKTTKQRSSSKKKGKKPRR
jgi:N-acetyltransferase 10